MSRGARVVAGRRSGRSGQVARQPEAAGPRVAWSPGAAGPRGLTGLLALVAVAGAAASAGWGGGLSWSLAGGLSQALAVLGCGALLLPRAGAAGMARLLILSGGAWSTAVGLVGFADAANRYGWPGATAAAWVESWLWALWVVPMTTLLPLLFPDGRPLSPRWQPLVGLSLATTGLLAVAAATVPGPLVVGTAAWSTGTSLNPFAVSEPVSALLTATASPVWALVALCCIGSLVARWIGADAMQRAQLSYLVLAMIAIVVVQVLAPLLPPAVARPLLELQPLIVVAAVVLAVARYQLYGTAAVVSTAVVYTVLTGLVLVTYVGVVLGMTALVGAAVATPVAPLLASVVIAVGVDPARRWTRRWVGRILYGQRDEPIEALARMRERLAGVVDDADVLPAAARTVAASLRTPYVAVVLLREGRPEVVAHVGEAVAEVVEVAMLVQSEQVGSLVVAERRPGEAFTRADHVLLAELAAQAAAVVHRLRLTEDLERARRRALHMSIRQRRQIRADLHDGLGPHLAGARLSLDGVRRGLPADEPLAAALGRISDSLAAATAEVRRIVDAAPTDPLTDRSLEQAIGRFVDRLHGGPSFQLDLRLGPLPPATELVAYRIVLEAVTNVVRHAGARTCRIALHHREHELDLRICDDGGGLGERYLTGIGIPSMRERAATVGGSLTVGTAAGGGTVVQATLPVESSPG